MENFESPQGKIKEKSVYLLHLDAPRIILIVCIILGIMVTTFLLGMNFMGKDDSHGSPIAQSEKADLSKDAALLGSDIPPLPSDDPSKPAEEKILPGEKSSLKAPVSPAIEKKEAPDLLTNDNLKDETIIKPKDQKKSKAERRSDDTPPKELALKKSKKGDKNKPAKSSKEKSRVVEVVDNTSEKSEVRGAGFAIQVASYDSQDKASSEVKALRGMKYNAYVDKTVLRGQKYYRVKIGPLSSKKKALDVLNAVQEKSRYRDSYLVKQ